MAPPDFRDMGEEKSSGGKGPTPPTLINKPPTQEKRKKGRGVN